MAALGAVALPAVWRRLAPAIPNRLEGHLGLTVRLAVATTLAVIGTGLYLLVNGTVYGTPTSSAELDRFVGEDLELIPERDTARRWPGRSRPDPGGGLLGSKGLAT